MKRGKKIKPIRVTISTAKLAKIMRRANIDYKDNELMRDAYLAGIRDVVGEDDGWAFRRAVLANDRRDAARFCYDGWKILGVEAAEFSDQIQMADYLNQIRRLCAKAIKEAR